MSEAKRQYMVRDLHDWCEYCGAECKWPDAFPIRSVLPLRLTLAANCQPALIKAICKSLIVSQSGYLLWLYNSIIIAVAAAWRDNKDIGNREVCAGSITLLFKLYTWRLSLISNYMNPLLYVLFLVCSGFIWSCQWGRQRQGRALAKGGGVWPCQSTAICKYVKVRCVVYYPPVTAAIY